MLEISEPPLSTFAEWRSWVTNAGLQPLVLVSGSRGKTTVALLLESIARQAGLSVAVWTDAGVHIDGVRQKGELVPWQEVEIGLTDGTIDLAIREVDWVMAATMATAPRVPVLAVTNACQNREDCIEAGDGRLVSAAMPALLTAVVNQGWLVLNGEDLAVSADLAETDHNRLLVSLGLQSPAVEDHLRNSGNLSWLADDQIFISARGRLHELGSRFEFPFALDGIANFAIFNAMMAASLATVIGIDDRTIRTSLQQFTADPEMAPGSFNIMLTGNSVLILDHPAASWYLRPVLRALRDYHRGRMLTVFSGLKGASLDNTAELGRLLGRISNILIVSDDEPNDAERIARAMEGARRNEVPPVLIPVTSEIEGVRRAMGLARPKDVIYVLSDDPAALWTSIKELGPLVQPQSLMAVARGL